MDEKNILTETCLNCGKTLRFTPDDICTDDFGDYIKCPDCGAQSDVNVSCETKLNEYISTEDRPLYDAVESISDYACQLTSGDDIAEDYDNDLVFYIHRNDEDTFDISVGYKGELQYDLSKSDVDILDLDTTLVNIVKSMYKQSDVDKKEELFNVNIDAGNEVLSKKQEGRRKADSVTEYTITFSDGELYDEYGGEFISEDKDEADELFDSIKAENKLDQVEQYYAKTWIWEGSDYSEDDVKVYYTKGDYINESCKQKAGKKIEKVNKDNIEINKAIGSPRKGKNPERIRAAGYEVDEYGNVTNPKTGKTIHPAGVGYTQDEKNKIDFKGMLDTDYASKPAKDSLDSETVRRLKLPKSLKVGKADGVYDVYNSDDLDKQFNIFGAPKKKKSISQNINDYKDMKTDIRDAKRTVRDYDIDIQRAKNDIEDAKEKIKDTNIKKKDAQKDVRNLEKQKDKFMDKVRAEHNKNNEENETEDLQEARRNPKVNTINKGNNKMDFSNTKRNKFRSVDQANRNFLRDLQGNSAKGSGTWEENPNETSAEYINNKKEIASNNELINKGKTLSSDDNRLQDVVNNVNQELIKKNQDLKDRNKEIIADKNKKKLNKKQEANDGNSIDNQNLENIKDTLRASGIQSERTLDLMSKDILNDLKRNYTNNCKDENGIYYGVVITDAFKKKVQQITGKTPNTKIGEARSHKNESNSGDTLYICIGDNQGGTWGVGHVMTAEEWGETASSWAESDGWEDDAIQSVLLKNFDSEQDCIDNIQETWEITIVPVTSPEAKEFLDSPYAEELLTSSAKKKLYGEARSHKEDNEKASPRQNMLDKALSGVGYGVYDDKDIRNIKDRYKEPIYAKRNKIKNFAELERDNKQHTINDIVKQSITHLDYEKMPNEKSSKYKRDKSLEETTNKGLEAKKKALADKTRQKLKDNGVEDWESLTFLSTKLSPEDLKEYLREEDEIWAIEMIHSILTYTSKDYWTVDYLMNNKYMAKYIKSLGEDKLRQIIADEIAEFEENATIENDVYTDSEDVSYNSVTFKDESKETSDKKYPRKIKTADGNTLTKVNDGTPENEYIPVYMNERGDETLVPDVEKYEIIEEAEEENPQAYEYMLLDRLRSDCDYYLGNGNRNDKYLWAGNVDGQIAKMKELWNKLNEKPEWLTMEDIENYAKEMSANELPSSTDGTAKQEIQNMLDRAYNKETKVGLEEDYDDEDYNNEHYYFSIVLSTSNPNAPDFKKLTHHIENLIDYNESDYPISIYNVEVKPEKDNTVTITGNMDITFDEDPLSQEELTEYLYDFIDVDAWSDLDVELESISLQLTENKKSLTERNWKFKFDNSLRNAIIDQDTKAVIECIKKYCDTILNAENIDEDTKAQFESYINYYNEEFDWILSDIAEDPNKAEDFEDFTNRALSYFHDLCDDTDVFVELL